MSQFRRSIPFLFLLLFALCYYGSYYRCSLYPAGEGGVEGVTVLRLLDGKIPFVEAILNYNLLWFYPIAALFKIFGPSYTLLRVFFFFLATLTGFLSFYVVRLTTRKLYVAMLAGMLTLILPGQLFRNYMAFLVMLNLALFLRAFLSSHSTTPRRLLSIGAAGLGLSLTFLIRIDLGFFLSVIFLGLSVIFPWIDADQQKTSRSIIHRLRLSIAAFLLGVVGFLALHLPVYYDALQRGFAPKFTSQYQQWPHLIITEGKQLLRNIPLPSFQSKTALPVSPTIKASAQPILSASPSKTTKTTLLRRSLFSSDVRERITALNLYLPILCSLLLIIMGVGFFFKKRNHQISHQKTFQLLTSLGCSLTLFPQYFFWRPDMVHLSEFMVPMTVTLIISIVFGLKFWSSSKRLFRFFIGLFLCCGIITLALYFINGCQSQSTGGIAIREGRTQEFCGQNGVHVKLKPEELEETSAIYQSILRHSKPGDYIVCFPYNPEINFMTNRPSYRLDLYCDDMTAPAYFDEVAIREIATFHPAVIVINNWPINGTEHSRFTNWATKTYDYIRSHYVLDYSKGIIEVFVRDQI